MSADWIEGRFEGVYSGSRRPVPETRGPRGANSRVPAYSKLRRFGFEIESGQIRNVSACDAPASQAIDDASVIRQARVKRVRIVQADGAASDVRRAEGETSLFDVEIRDWHLKHPAEAGDRAFGTLVGTIRARRRPALGEPVVSLEPSPPAHRPETLANEDPTPLVPKHIRNETVEAVAIEAGPGWAEVLSLMAIVFAGVGYACGLRSAGVWLAPVAAALGLLWVSSGGLVSGAPRWLLGSLVLIQCYVLASPVERAWQSGCWPALGIESLAVLAAPVVLSALLGSRGAIFLTGLIWTVVVCSHCMTTSAESCWAASQGATAIPSDAPTQEHPRRRNDEHGRWPVMPPMPAHRLAPGALPMSDATVEVPSTTGPDDASLPTSEAASQPTPTPFVEAEVAPGESGPALSGDRRLTQVDGGWLSPEHRRAPREYVLISVEQANRTPALFFANHGAHRVYVPTDPLFEHDSASLRRDAPLVLARVAALLSLPDQPPVVLEVHTDSAGAPEHQIELSRRRAEIVRSWLVDRGHVSPGRFQMRAIGGGRPLVPPDGDYGAQQPNRRIEIQLVEEG